MEYKIDLFLSPNPLSGKLELPFEKDELLYALAERLESIADSLKAIAEKMGDSLNPDYVIRETMKNDVQKLLDARRAKLEKVDEDDPFGDFRTAPPVVDHPRATTPLADNDGGNVSDRPVEADEDAIFNPAWIKKMAKEILAECSAAREKGEGHER